MSIYTSDIDGMSCDEKHSLFMLQCFFRFYIKQYQPSSTCIYQNIDGLWQKHDGYICIY